MSMRKIEVLTIILRGRIVNISYYLTLPLSIPAESIAFAPVRLAWQPRREPKPRKANPGTAAINLLRARIELTFLLLQSNALNH